MTDEFLDDTRFVQIALIRSLCSRWTAKDKIVVFLTEEARKANWQDDGHIDLNTQTELKRVGLKNAIDALGLPLVVNSASIKDGGNERELWENFRIILSYLEKGDEIYFDITHSFRSLPMLVVVILMYARTVKKILIKGIFYGAFETLGPIGKVKGLPMKDRNVSIFDLAPFISLLEWSLATNSFVEFGDAKLMKELLDTSINPILKTTRGRDEIAQLLRSISNQLNALSLSIKTCRGSELVGRMDYESMNDDLDNFRELVSPTQGEVISPPFLPLIELVKDKIQDFHNNDVKNGLTAVKWCIEHELVQQGITILQETMINIAIKEYTGRSNVPSEVHDREFREITSDALRYSSLSKDKGNWDFRSEKSRQITERYENMLNPEFVKLYDKISQLRNDINHSGFLKGCKKSREILESLEKYYEKIAEITIRRNSFQGD